jgi:hypothetical protein
MALTQPLPLTARTSNEGACPTLLCIQYLITYLPDFLRLKEHPDAVILIIFYLLHSRRVPGFETAKCQCGAGDETPRRMALFCVQEASRKQYLQDRLGRTQPYSKLVGTYEEAKRFVRWMMSSNRLSQCALAKRLLFIAFSSTNR